jgi:hypothetical protein
VFLGFHGISCELPDTWECIATAGDWRRGRVVLAEGRTAVLGLSWERRPIAADLVRSLTAALAPLARDLGPGSADPISDDDRDCASVRYRGAQGDGHAIAVRRPGGALVARQLTPGPLAPLRQLAASCTVAADDAPARWAIHGLDAELPPWWRLEGIQHVAGLTRAVWFHRRPHAVGIAAALVMRRLACASRLAPDGDVEAFLRRNLVPDEHVQRGEAPDGVVHLLCERPAASWWERWRGRRRRRRLHAWRTPGDRLVVQEWSGYGEPLPALRRATTDAGG